MRARQLLLEEDAIDERIQRNHETLIELLCAVSGSILDTTNVLGPVDRLKDDMTACLREKESVHARSDTLISRNVAFFGRIQICTNPYSHSPLPGLTSMAGPAPRCAGR